MRERKTGILGTLVLVVIALELFTYAGTLGSTLSIVRSDSSVQPATTPNDLTLNITLAGAGATFPQPLITAWEQAYHASHPNVTITYPIPGGGSGKGQAAALNKTKDFGASDAPLSARQRALYPNILHIPETIGSVTLSYNIALTNGTNLPRGSLNFTGAVIANIYLGVIKTWNDPAIQAINPGIASLLPAQSILTAHRFDGSGTTFVFTSYLCEESKTWLTQVGNGTSVTWPQAAINTAVSGNQNLANYVNSTLYSLGYVELQYAAGGGLHYAKLLNGDGTSFVLPTLQTTTNAVTNSTLSLPTSSGDWSQVRMLNAPKAETYPIASFSYFLVYKEQNVVPSMDLNDKAQFKALVDFLTWAVTLGQGYASNLNYVPLPAAVVAIDQAGINSMRYTEVSTPVSHSLALRIGGAGWNDSSPNPGPSLTFVSGDHVTINFISTDLLPHQWYIDFNNDATQDTNETNISKSFSTAGPNLYPFTPVIWNQTSIPHAGMYTYRDVNTGATGSITILPQQVAAVLADSAVDFTKNSVTHLPNLPFIDNTMVGTVGSLVINMRNMTATGNVTIAAADIGTQSITYTKTYTINLQLGPTSGVTGVGLRFILNVAVAAPFYALSSNILVQLQGTTATTSSSLTRELDMNGHGVVDVTDVGLVISAYGKTKGSPGYNPLADLAGTGVVYITGIGPLFANYNYKAFS